MDARLFCVRVERPFSNLEYTVQIAWTLWALHLHSTRSVRFCCTLLENHEGKVFAFMPKWCWRQLPVRQVHER